MPWKRAFVSKSTIVTDDGDNDDHDDDNDNDDEEKEDDDDVANDDADLPNHLPAIGKNSTVKKSLWPTNT